MFQKRTALPVKENLGKDATKATAEEVNTAITKTVKQLTDAEKKKSLQFNKLYQSAYNSINENEFKGKLPTYGRGIEIWWTKGTMRNGQSLVAFDDAAKKWVMYITNTVYDPDQVTEKAKNVISNACSTLSLLLPLHEINTSSNSSTSDNNFLDDFRIDNWDDNRQWNKKRKR